ncbi:MAG: class I adenylate-forming enzyme family protein [Acidobacteriota bacterium]
MQLARIYEQSLEQAPDKVAFYCGDNSCTYGKLDEMARRYAAALSGLGVKQGDRVALLMYNRPEIVWFMFGCFKLGAVAVPVSCFSARDEVAHDVGHSGAKLLFASGEHYPAIRDIDGLPSLEAIHCIDSGADSQSAAWREMLDRAVPFADPVELDPSAPAVILYTSGSTSRPKGVTHTHRSLWSCSVNRIETLSCTRDDRFVNVGYLCHGAAFSTALLPMLHVGGTAIFLPRYSSNGLLAVLARHRPTLGAAGPSHVWEILDHPQRPETDFGCLRYFSAGGDAVHEALFDAFQTKTGLPLSASMGMTECGTYLTSPSGAPHKRGSLGVPTYGVEVRMVDEEGKDVPQGEVGQLIVRSDTVMSGYWNDPENTGATLVGGWLYTGDLAHRDEDGYFYFVSRSKNMIVRDSGNISPGEVEDAINLHPAVRCSGVLGIPDKLHGQGVCAFVEFWDSAAQVPAPEELQAFLSTRLAARKMPDHWVIIEKLPATPYGKVDRKALKQLAGERFEIDLT